MNRYVLVSGIKGIESELLAEFTQPYVPFFNAHPGGSWPIVLNESPTRITQARWGLVPYWSRWYGGPHHYNAFVAEVVKHPVFKIPIRKRRCLIPVNCFIMWSRREGGRIPFAVYIKEQRVFTIAGIYDTWKDRQTGFCHYTYAVISTFSCKRLNPYFPTMPAIISPSRRTKYLKEDIHLNEVMHLLRPYEKDQLNLYPLSEAVNDPFINDRRVVQPVGEKVYRDFDYKPKESSYFDR